MRCLLLSVLTSAYSPSLADAYSGYRFMPPVALVQHRNETEAGNESQPGPGVESKDASDGLPDQGFQGDAVKHENKTTATDDWRQEYGPNGPQQHRNETEAGNESQPG